MDFGMGQQTIANHVGGLQRDRGATIPAMGQADAGKQQTQIVIDLRDRGHGTPSAGRSRFLIDGHGRRQTVDPIDIRTRHRIKKLPGIGRKAVDVLTLAFGEQCVEGERAFAAAGNPRDHRERIAWDIDVDRLQIVNTSAANSDRADGSRFRHRTVACWGENCVVSGSLSQPSIQSTSALAEATRWTTAR